ncbi:MAG: O-antigen ligase family protein [Actinomycetia bacterium]|nr:O-antigen ligase family protein [Actinomycetes bacterium]
MFAVWPAASYSAGGYLPQKWLPLALLVGFAGLVAAGLRAYPHPPARPLPVILGFFFLYVLWMALSATWAPGPAPAWRETARAGFYLVFFALALTYLGPPQVEKKSRWLFPVAGLVIIAVALVRFSSLSTMAADFFGERRLSYPLTYPNSTGNFYLLLVWPLLWLAADPQERLWVRAVSLGTIPVLLELMVLTQSRGAMTALVLSAVVYFLVTPARLRSLFFLVVPVVLVALAFMPLTAYYTDGVGRVGNRVALLWLGGSLVVAAIAGLLFALADRHLRLPLRPRLVLSVLVSVVLLVAAVTGTVQLRERVGDLTEWAADVVDSVIHGETGTGTEGLGGSRFGAMGGNGRGVIWETAWQGFLERPLTGNGAAGYRYINELHRTDARTDPQHAHSIELELLAETGVVGTILFVGAFGSALGLALVPRFRSWRALVRRRRPFLLDARDDVAPGDMATGRATGGTGGGTGGSTSIVTTGSQAWIAALVTAVGFWLIHASVDWLWQFPGVVLGVLLLLAYALAASRRSAGRRAGLRPRLFRVGLGVVSVALLVGAGLPYLSLQYQNLALAEMGTDQAAALDHASTAQTLFPVSPDPLLVRADVYRAAAEKAAAFESAQEPEEAAESTSAVLEALALALAVNEQAIQKEEASSEVHTQAGVAALDLLATRQPAALSEAVYGTAYGTEVARWAELGAGGPPDAAQELGTSAQEAGGVSIVAAARARATSEERQAARTILELTNRELLARAEQHLQEALERDPQDPGLQELVAALGA